MTPLASYLAKQIVARPKHREYIWREPKNIDQLRKHMEGVHCFEVSACLPLLNELAPSLKIKCEGGDESMFETFAFLPAPKTWVEWRQSGDRVAVMLEECKPGLAFATMYSRLMAVNLGTISLTSQDHYDLGGQRCFPTFLANTFGHDTGRHLLVLAHSMLLLINSPRVIGRRQHMPNAGLERRLVTGLGPGKFPLHAWTEILLEVNKPTEIDDGEPHEAHLTGGRALHFVRKHIRIRLGRLEYVSAHWRGDPAIGIKQSRYIVAP